MEKGKIKVDYLARVEGEAGLDIVVRGGEISELSLRIFEPPRFFEGWLVGRRYDEVPEMVSRICGICPVPHQLAAAQALEMAFGLEISEQTRTLRRLLALSQWIQSHSLHIYFLAAPDYLGYESSIAMAQVEELKPAVQRALRLKRLGNDLTCLVGGREVHPVTVKVNGFSALPSKDGLHEIHGRLVAAREDALETLRLLSTLKLPDLRRPTEFVALRPEEGYPVNEGRLVSSEGLDVPAHEYRQWLVEKHVARSNAKHAVVAGRDSFAVGPLARVNLNQDRLYPVVRDAIADFGFVFPNDNPFYSAVARGVELMQAIEECIDIIENLDLKEEDGRFRLQVGEGASITEAARGICCHAYEVNSHGLVEKADIVAPTARNAYNIEKDLWEFLPGILDRPEEEVTLECEKLVRAYDPCFSCSVHFLKVNLRHE